MKSLYTGILLLITIFCQAQQMTDQTVAPDGIRRISFAGSSVTWGDGFLQSGLVKESILNIQRGQAVTVEPGAVHVTGNGTVLNGPDNRKYFGGEAVKITGAGARITFSMTGDELTLVQGIQRSNEGAAEVELYVDGRLHDTFTNWNTGPIGTSEKVFAGDGENKQFDLGRAFTFGHRLSVNGRSLSGAHNKGGYGGGDVPDSLDYLVIRKYGSGPDGNPEVHHWILFKQAPAKGSEVVVSFSYGEEISYEKTTIGKSADGELESPFGDGDVSFDITKPSRVSSGLDYRQTDDRAVKTYRFDDVKKREVELRIKGSYRNAKGVPYFIFNFATNRFFAFQNAGIGGWKLSFFNNPDEFHRGYRKIAEFSPDVLFFETTPNDDWSVGGYRLYTEYKDLSLQQLQGMRTLPIKSIAYNKQGNTYNFQKWVGKIADIDGSSAAFLVDQQHRAEEAPQPGDYVFLGGYYANNKEYAVRRVTRYDAASHRVFFDRPLLPGDLIYNDLDVLKGMEIRIRSFTLFEREFRQFVQYVRQLKPEVKIASMVNPLPIIGARELWGYWELMEDITGEMNVNNLAVQSFYDFQYSQKQVGEAEVDAGMLKRNPLTGYMEAGIDGFDRRNRQNYEVLVNGVNVYGTAAVVRNPYAYGVDRELEGETLQMDHLTEGVRAKQQINQKMELVFFKDAPRTGKIRIRFSTTNWSGDGCHVRTGDVGSGIYGALYYDFFKTLDKQPPHSF